MVVVVGVVVGVVGGCDSPSSSLQFVYIPPITTVSAITYSICLHPSVSMLYMYI